MDRILVVVFDSENRRMRGRRRFRNWPRGQYRLYASAVLAKQSDGTQTIKQGDDAGPIGTLAGTSFGLSWPVGRPSGLLAGAAAGMGAGSVVALQTLASARISSTPSPRCSAEQVALVATSTRTGLRR